MHEARQRAIHGLVEELATDIGRLRRHPACQPDTSLAYLADRLASAVDTIDCIIQPSAAELAAIVWPDDDQTVQDAIAAVTARARRLNTLMAGTTR